MGHLIPLIELRLLDCIQQLLGALLRLSFGFHIVLAIVYELALDARTDVQCHLPYLIA